MGKHGPMASPSFSSTASFQSMIAEYVIKNEIENQKGPKFGQVYELNLSFKKDFLGTQILELYYH